jgi:hypothetical protein
MKTKDGYDSPCKEVPEVHELAMTFVLNINDTPTVLATTDRLPVDDHITFRPHDSERNYVLYVADVRTNCEVRHDDARTLMDSLSCSSSSSFSSVSKGYSRIL